MTVSVMLVAYIVGCVLSHIVTYLIFRDHRLVFAIGKREERKPFYKLEQSKTSWDDSYYVYKYEYGPHMDHPFIFLSLILLPFVTVVLRKYHSTGHYSYAKNNSELLNSDEPICEYYESIHQMLESQDRITNEINRKIKNKIKELSNC